MLRDRVSGLSGAIARISASLDLDTVLHEVVDAARALTGARCGCIATTDGAGQLEDFVTSGVTPEQHQRLLDLPQGRNVWEYLLEDPRPLRLTDLPSHLSSHGLPVDPVLPRTFLGAPIRYQGVQVGNFCLGDRDGGREFTDEDEEILVLFASQAATAIANARAYRDEQRARADLEELERSRTEFVSLVSHELRAPLLSIKGAAVTMLEAASSPDRAEVREFFRIVNEQANHMRGLISDLLDAGRIETGTLSVSPEPADVAGLVDRARTTFASGGSPHTVLIDLPLELPRVQADAQRIVQILNNLLANAARHAPEFSPIRVSAVRDGVHVAISVADEGRGVPPERLPHLFRKHARVAGGGGIGGTGLGLAICKGLVETHGGRIWAESGGAGLGTRITFTLPMAKELATGAVQSPAGGPGDGLESVRILVVDDDPQTLRDMRETLTAAGYTPLLTGDPRQVPGLLKSEEPRLVLLDLMLPDVDGIELMERVPELADLPVIFLSVYGRDETIARALEMGAADYIVKPFSPTELTARVGAALRRHAEPDPCRLGALAIDFRARRVSVDGQPVELTATEYDLLRVLALNAGRVVTHETLLRQVWQRNHADDSNRVRAFVKKLRHKLGDDAASPAYVSSVRGVGYRLAPPGGR